MSKGTAPRTHRHRMDPAQALGLLPVWSRLAQITHTVGQRAAATDDAFLAGLTTDLLSALGSLHSEIERLAAAPPTDGGPA